MTVMFYIVDDHRERAECLMRVIRASGNRSKWLRPQPANCSSAPNQDEVHLSTVDQLETILGTPDEEPAAWIWDIQLIFNGPEGTTLSNSDYSSGGRLFRPLVVLAHAKHRIFFVSSALGSDEIREDLVKAGATKDFVGGTQRSWTSLTDRTGQTEWANRLVVEILRTFGGGIWEDIRDGGAGQFTLDESPNDFTTGLTSLPHSWSVYKEWLDKLATRQGATQILSSVLARTLFRRGAGDADEWSRIILKNPDNFEGVFESLKTLVGANAKTTRRDGYVPCLGVLPLLTLRAMHKSGQWEVSEVAGLFENVSWHADLRGYPLASDLQTADALWAWLKCLDEELLAGLTERLIGSELKRIELSKAGFFRLVFKKEWTSLFAKIDGDSGAGANTFGNLKKAQRLLGSIGEGGGCDPACTISVYRDDSGDTCWDFRSNRRV